MARLKYTGSITDISGHLAGTTFQKTKWGSCMQKKIIPVAKQTPATSSYRNKFQSAVKSWHSLTPEQISAWNAAAPAGLNGFQHFNSYNIPAQQATNSIISAPPTFPANTSIDINELFFDINTNKLYWTPPYNILAGSYYISTAMQPFGVIQPVSTYPDYLSANGKVVYDGINQVELPVNANVMQSVLSGGIYSHLTITAIANSTNQKFSTPNTLINLNLISMKQIFFARLIGTPIPIPFNYIHVYASFTETVHIIFMKNETIITEKDDGELDEVGSIIEGETADYKVLCSNANACNGLSADTENL